MPLAFNIQNTVINGNRRETYGSVTFDSSYPTNGEPFTARDVGLTNLETIEVQPSSTGYVVVWNRSASAPTLIAQYGDNNNAADGPLVEVPNTTNLATLVASFRAIGW